MFYSKTMSLACTTITSLIGPLTLIASDAGVTAILWEKDKDGGRVKIENAAQNDRHPILLETQRQLKEYFDGHRTEFSLPLDLRGTEFQKKVWAALQTIPYGKTCSYADIARKIGAPDAVRAVGAANGKNPVGIVVPCHRVIGSGGKLTGFAAGLEIKARLLHIESREQTLFPELGAA